MFKTIQLWTFLAFFVLAGVSPAGNGAVCQEDCRVRYSIDSYRDGTARPPSDWGRWRDYQKCLEKCDAFDWSDD